ncbi:MAG: hypothetical protein ACI92I_000738 [Acidimicrobiales bacterium]|jgi:hypothetical protein
MEETLGVVVRDFTGGAGRIIDNEVKQLNSQDFLKKSKVVVGLLKSELINVIVIASNRDKESKFGEASDNNGHTPTWRAYVQHYPELTEAGKLVPVFVDTWGSNAGSGRAVQAGIDYVLKETNLPYAMAWSPELAITPARLAKAVGFLEHYGLDGIGFLREHFFTRPQWMLPQHTGLVASRSCWELATIPKYADGDEGLTIETTVGPAKVAGMDDMARLLLAWKQKPDLRIGMYGWNDPITWDIDPNDTRQAEKIARQWEVVNQWTLRTFPDASSEATLARIMSSLKMF